MAWRRMARIRRGGLFFVHNFEGMFIFQELFGMICPSRAELPGTRSLSLVLFVRKIIIFGFLCSENLQPSFMPAKFRQDRIRLAGQNISYYNEIAANYDNILARENANKLVRRNVAERFMEKIGKGTIMDFGGGTGL